MQLTLNLAPGLSSAYPTCREFVAARVHQLGRPQKAIAADLDMAPSQLTRKLAQAPGDSARFTLDDLEQYIASTGDADPVLYLADKYLRRADPDELRARIAELELQLDAAGVHRARRAIG
mgnify:CR=1 FL=1